MSSDNLDNSLDDQLAAYDFLATYDADDPAAWPLLLAGEPPNSPHVRGLARELYLLQVTWQQAWTQRMLGA